MGALIELRRVVGAARVAAGRRARARVAGGGGAPRVAGGDWCGRRGVVWEGGRRATLCRAMGRPLAGVVHGAGPKFDQRAKKALKAPSGG